MKAEKTKNMNLHYIPALSKFVLLDGLKKNGRHSIKSLPLDIYYIDGLHNLLDKYEELEKIYSNKIEKIEKEMRRRNIKYMPVVEAGKLAGIVTLKDVIKYFEFRVNYLTFK